MAFNIISRPHQASRINYNQIKGSGIYQRGSICQLDKCKPRPNTTPKSPKPTSLNKTPLTPLNATKLSSKDNKWRLRNTTYPNFNTLWVNIPNGNFTVLRNVS